MGTVVVWSILPSGQAGAWWEVTLDIQKPLFWRRENAKPPQLWATTRENHYLSCLPVSCL